MKLPQPFSNPDFAFQNAIVHKTPERINRLVECAKTPPNSASNVSTHTQTAMPTRNTPKKPSRNLRRASEQLLAALERLADGPKPIKEWWGWENGHGQEVGAEMDRCIARLKRELAKPEVKPDELTPANIKAAADLLVRAFKETGSPFSTIEDHESESAVIICVGPRTGAILKHLNLF